MSIIRWKLTVPNPNLDWWKSSKKELLQVVEQHHMEAWYASQDPVTGKQWAPRKEPTGPHPILKKSGKMLSSTKFKADQHPMLFRATTNVSYGKFHQTGTSRMPQRRWLGLGGKFEDKFAAVLKKHLFKGKTVMKAGY